MKPKIFVTAVLLALAGWLAPAQDAPREIQMTAEKYDFKPDTVTVKRGDRVRLVITSRDRDHGIKIAAFQVDQKLPKGEPVTVEFTADQSGTFPFECSVFCGLGHKKMKGKLVVEQHPP